MGRAAGAVGLTIHSLLGIILVMGYNDVFRLGNGLTRESLPAAAFRIASGIAVYGWWIIPLIVIGLARKK